MSVLMDRVRRRKTNRVQHEIFVLLPPPLKWFGWTVVSIFFASVIYANFAQISKKERIKGILTSENDPVLISSSSEGTISRVLVRDGELVSAGQPLFSINTETFHKDSANSIESSSSKRLIDILGEKENALLELPEKHVLRLSSLQQRMQSNESQIAAINRQLATAKDRLTLAKKQLEQLISIESKGYISSLEVNRLRDSTLSFLQQIDSLEREKIEKNAANEDLKTEIESSYFQNQENSIALRNEIATLKSQISALSEKEERIIVSPIHGIVDNMQIRAGQSMIDNVAQMHIKPTQQSLMITAYAPTRAAVFIEKGMEVKVRFNDFPYQRFGSYTGIVKRVGLTAILPKEATKMSISEPSYEIQIELQKQEVSAYGKVFNVRTGMIVETDIITDQQSLLYWLFEPVLAMYQKI